MESRLRQHIGTRRLRCKIGAVKKNKGDDDCPICLYLADHPGGRGAVTELLTFLSNRSASFFMSELTGDKVASAQIENHKLLHQTSFAPPFSDLQKLYSSLDLSTDEGRTAAYAFDSLHGLILSPGKTGPYAGLQALKMLMDAAKDKQESSGDFVAGVFKVVLEAVKDPEDRKAVAEALKHWQEGKANGQ